MTNLELGKEFILQHISDKPWSDYTSSDYSLEQWHNACLIHQHDGPPTSKNECKLPVRTPNGALNRNGVHAAAAALAGARGGVNASSEEKTKAANALVRFYRELNEDPPPSLLQHSNFFSHHGIKGMKWGIRNRKKIKPSVDFKTTAVLRKKPVPALTNKQLKIVNERLNLETNFRKMNPTQVEKGHAQVKTILSIAGTATSLVALANSPAGRAAINNGKKFLTKSSGKHFIK